MPLNHHYCPGDLEPVYLCDFKRMSVCVSCVAALTPFNPIGIGTADGAKTTWGGRCANRD